METINIKKEEVFNPMSLINSIGSEIEEILEIHELDKRELGNKLGWSDFASKISLNKKELEIITNYICIDDDFNTYLIKFQKEYFKNKEIINKSYKIHKSSFRELNSMLPMLGNEFNNGIDILEDITDFFGVESEEEIFESTQEYTMVFRKNMSIEINKINLKAWLRRGELNFNKLKLPQYYKTLLINWVENKEWKSKITDVDYFLSLPKLFEKFGVGLIYVEYLPKTVYGAVVWINNIPLIQISDRDNDLATCWFTLFHEIGHVILQENTNVYDVEINKTTTSKNEKEANKFANNYLLNGDGLRKEVFYLKDKANYSITAKELSEKYNIDEIFAAYWMRRSQYNPNKQLRIPINF